MAIEKEVKITVKETGMDVLQKKVMSLENSIESLEDQNESLSKSLKGSGQSVLDNGGAMGLLNDATGGLAMTIKDAVESLDLFSKGSRIATFQQTIYTTVVGTSTGAMKAFRIALAATGVGLLIIGLVALIANFDKVKKAVLNVIPGLAKVGDFIGGLIDGFTDFIGVTSEAERAMAELTAQADKSLAMNKKFLAEEGDRINKYTKQKIDAKNAYYEAIKEDGANQTKLAARLNRELAAIDKQHNEDLDKVRKDNQKKLDDENEKLAEKEKAAREKAFEERKKLREKEKAEIEADRLALLDFQKKIVESDIEADIEAKNQKEENRRIQSEKIAQEEERLFAENEKRLENEKVFQENLQNVKTSAADNTINLLATLAKKGSAISKALAIADIVREQVKSVSSGLSNLAIANAKAVAASPLTAGQPFVGINTVSTLAGLAAGAAGAGKAIKDILSESKTPSTSGGSSASSGGGGTPAPSFNLVQGTGSNQIAQSLSSNDKPIKAFVVGSEVSTQQQLDRNIVKNASLG